MIIWKDVVGSNGEYQISNTGIVITTKTGRILSPAVDARGYERVALFKMDRKKRYKVHRLVAMAFIPNPDNLPQVNHKDGNKRNNNVDNLEWITNADNMRHAKESGLREGHKRYCDSRKKRIIATNIATGEEVRFESMLSASKTLGTKHIQEVLKGERKQAKGFTFRYEGGDA